MDAFLQLPDPNAEFAPQMAMSPDLAALYGTLAPGLVRFAYMLTGSREVAEDVVHDAFVRSAGRIGTVDVPEAYLRRSIVNAIRSLHRRRIVAESKATHAADVYVDDHELTEFRDALLQLSPRQRAAVVLRYLYQLHDDEIAASLGCRRATVRSLVKRGLAQLREELS